MAAESMPYLMSDRELPLIVFVNETLVQERHQGIGVHVRCKVKLSVRLMHPPLLLQLGSRLSIICSGQNQFRFVLFQHAQEAMTESSFKEKLAGGSPAR